MTETSGPSLRNAGLRGVAYSGGAPQLSGQSVERVTLPPLVFVVGREHEVRLAELRDEVGDAVVLGVARIGRAVELPGDGEQRLTDHGVPLVDVAGERGDGAA